MAVQVVEVDTEHPEDLQAAVKLIYAYTTWLGVDLTFQDFDAEMAAMPGKYAPPTGSLLIARNDANVPIGVVGLRQIVPDDGRAGCCEMKRLYVLPEGRGTGAGRALLEAVIARARQLGHKEILLDSLNWMKEAQALYDQYGFEVTEKYYYNPHQGVIFRALKLDGGDQRMQNIQ